MEKKRYMLVLLPILALILEILPYGAVLNFGRPATDGTIGFFRETYSYFSLMPFGYANFGPLLTAVLTCLLLILGIVCVCMKKASLQKAIKVVSIIATVTSLMPLMLGVRFYSIVGALITMVLVLELYFLCKNKED